MTIQKTAGLSDEELEYADEAVNEYEERGLTQKTCPRCGGVFSINIVGNSYSIECAGGDFKFTSRGI